MALRPLMDASDDTLFRDLKESYRRGIPKGWSAGDAEAAAQAYSAIVEAVGPAPAGGDRSLAPGTFWTGFSR